MPKKVLAALTLLLTCAGGATAVVHDRSDSSPLAAKEFMLPSLEAPSSLSQVLDLPPQWKLTSLADLDRLGLESHRALFDRRGARWGALMPAIPLIPGSGVGNSITWEGLGGVPPVGDDALGRVTYERLRDYLAQSADSLRVDPSEFEHRLAVHEGGAIVQMTASRVLGDIPVRGAHFTAVVNHGNIVLMGSERWGDIGLSVVPSIGADRALSAVERFIAPMSVTFLREQSTLAILPVSAGDTFDIGSGYNHRLAWVVRPAIPDDLGQWEALVDAHNGELLAFQDLNHYGTDRVVKGAVYPENYDGNPVDGVEIFGYPMPFADLSSGGFTDAGGNFAAAGNVTTTLSGQFVNIAETCGAISESSTGDIDLEGGPGTPIDCQVPPGHSLGDTPAARTGFYEVNRINQMGRSQLPANTWLTNALTARMNISNVCNAFWTGTEIQFFRQTGNCANTGQIAGVFDHEWGHGLDDNDVGGNIPGSSQGGGEGMADIYAALRLDQGCVGRGFFLDGSTCSGYGDPCTPASGCTGIRSIDWADRASGLPHDLTWVQANCGTITHCLGAAYSETVWDIVTRDLPTSYGMDSNTAHEVGTRLTFIGAGNLTGWYTRTGTPGAAGCLATQGYLNYLAVDDDDGDFLNGTPHMTAIATAFDRHEIGCTPANGGPTVTDSGCAGTPTTAPAVTGTATNMGADLSWGAVAGAATYNIYRTDGERQCDRGKALVGSTAGLTFADSELMNGRNYYYVVTPMGSGGAMCFGPASSCVTVGGDAIFADGFESGDTTVWDTTVP